MHEHVKVERLRQDIIVDERHQGDEAIRDSSLPVRDIYADSERNLLNDKRLQLS